MDMFRRACIVAMLLGTILPVSAIVYFDVSQSELAVTYRNIWDIKERNLAKTSQDENRQSLIIREIREFDKILDADLSENLALRNQLYEYEVIAWHVLIIFPIIVLLTYISGNFIVFGKIPFIRPRR
jgi:hypothetical protein